MLKFLEQYKKNFTPKIIEILSKGYSLSLFKQDCLSGITVAVVSIPLAMALAIASGVSPAQGLYTAIIAGLFISLFGGSRYQIGGPTGAFVVVIFDIIATYGYSGLLIAMIIAGVILILAGFLKLGTYIKYIPYPVVTAFTAGIGLLLISTQVKDLLGLNITEVPSDFVEKWMIYFSNLNNLNISAVIVSIVSVSSIFYIKAKHQKLPAFLLSVIISTIIVAFIGLDVDTIGNKFGEIPHFLPAPKFPEIEMSLALKVLPSALTIAFLTGVESLLSATVVDGMSGDNHNSNAELIGEGAANLICACFMGIPATGAIARTATNFRANAYSPVSGVMQSAFLILFMLLLAPAAKYIPLSCLAVILILIGWNMLGIKKILNLIRGPKGDRYTLIVTLFLTVLVDLNAAISVGFIMASVIFMHRMSKEIEIETDEEVLDENYNGSDLTEVLRDQGVVSLRFSGPLFFGDASEISQFLKKINKAPKVLIIRMGYVPMVDASGANIIVEFVKKIQKDNGKIILSNVKKQPKRVLHEAFKKEGIDYHTISAASTFENALKMTKKYLKQQKDNQI
ncbi:MAG: SulP family inorganic anion transporter [Alphaproteobacteria bacterium]